MNESLTLTLIDDIINGVHSAFERIPANIYLYQIEDNKIIYANSKFKTLFSFSKSTTYEEISKHFFGQLNESQLNNIRYGLNDINAQFEYQSKFIDTKGKYHWTIVKESIFKKDLASSSNIIIGQIIDISEKIFQSRRTEADRRLREMLIKREHKLRNIAMLKSMEDERSRISREIHDGLGQILTGLKIKLQLLEEESGISAENKTQLKQINLLMKDAISETRRLSNDITPNAIHDFGLEPTINHFLELYVRPYFQNIEFFTNLKGSRLEPEKELTIFRIIQESINNCIKHSCASKLLIVIYKNTNQISLEIKDNGKGFDFEKHMKDPVMKISGKNGLYNILERTRLLYGTIQIQSSPSKGTSITATFPSKPTKQTSNDKDHNS